MTAEEQGGGADPHGQAAGSPALPSNAEIGQRIAAILDAAEASAREAAQRLEADVLGLVDPDVAAEQRANRPWPSFLRRDGQRPASVNGSAETAVKSPSDDLYERAKELRIRGRSKMSRDELEVAVQQQALVERD